MNLKNIILSTDQFEQIKNLSKKHKDFDINTNPISTKENKEYALNIVIREILYEIFDQIDEILKNKTIGIGYTSLGDYKQEQILEEEFKKRGWNVQFYDPSGGRAEMPGYQIKLGNINKKNKNNTNDIFSIIPNSFEIINIGKDVNNIIKDIKLSLKFNLGILEPSYIYYTEFLKSKGFYIPIEDDDYEFKNDEKNFYLKYKKIFKEKGWDVKVIDFNTFYQAENEWKELINHWQKNNVFKEKKWKKIKNSEYIIVKQITE